MIAQTLNESQSTPNKKAFKKQLIQQFALNGYEASQDAFKKGENTAVAFWQMLYPFKNTYKQVIFNQYEDNFFHFQDNGGMRGIQDFNTTLEGDVARKRLTVTEARILRERMYCNLKSHATKDMPEYLTVDFIFRYEYARILPMEEIDRMLKEVGILPQEYEGYATSKLIATTSNNGYTLEEFRNHRRNEANFNTEKLTILSRQKGSHLKRILHSLGRI